MEADKRKILIVDDEPDIRTVIKRRFELSGFECLTTEGGREAIEIAKAEKPCLIILDLITPEMDGYEVHKALKADKTTKGTPVIPYTARNPEVVANEGQGTFDLAAKGAEQLDVVDFILKPDGSEELVTAANRILGCAEKV